MGHAGRLELQSKGSLDAKPVIFVYEREAEAGRRAITWTEEQAPVEGAQWNRIQERSLIAVVPVHALVPDEYSILYVENNSAAQDDPQAAPVIFKYKIATNLPQSFVYDFQPSGKSCYTARHDGSRPIPTSHFIVSTKSGTGLASAVWETLHKPLIQHIYAKPKLQYALHFTTSERTVSEITQDIILPQANAGVAQSIGLLSGDGGVVDLINGLLSGQHTRQYVEPNIAILPLGTGNALAHSAGITNDNTLGMRTVVQGSPKELPLFCARFSPGARLLTNEGREERELHSVDGTPIAHGAVVCSWGLHAALVADSDTTAYRKFGAERFKMAAKEALFPSDGSPPHAYKGKVSVLRTSRKTNDDWELIPRTTHGYVLATLVSHLEKGFTISPSSKPLDGRLRLVHFGAISGQEATQVMTKAYDGGKHVLDDRVGYEEIDGLRIDFDEDEGRFRRICIDGKIVKVAKRGWLEVRSGVRGVVDLVAM